MNGEQLPHRTDELQHTSFLIILAVVSLLMLVIVWPFFQPLLWAALAAVMFQPLYRLVLREMRGRRNPAAALTLLLVFFVIMVPALWIGVMVVEEAAVLLAKLQQNPIDVAIIFDQIYSSLPRIAQRAIDRSEWANIEMIQQRLQDLLAESSGYIAAQAVSIGSGALSFFLSFGVALYIMFFLIRDGERVGRKIVRAIPVDRQITDRLADRFLSIVRATIKGTGVVAVVQGAIGAIVFAIAGVPSAMLFGVIMAIFALVPVIGSGGVWLPVGLWLLIIGETWQGLFVILSGFFIIASADNVLRPILVGRDTGIPDWIVLITTLGGISYLGLSGIILGPLVAGLFLASWGILREQREEDEEVLRQDALEEGDPGITSAIL